MSLQVSNHKPERDQIVALRVQSVFLFIATRCDADGYFSESDQYIANAVASSERKSVSRARTILEDRDDILVVEKDRYDPATGKKLPNKVRPVPIPTFWYRELVRQGSKGESCVHGENAVSCPRVNPSKDEGLTPVTSAPVSTAKHRGHDHKRALQRTESQSFLAEGYQNSLSTESLSTEHCARWSVHGEPFTKYIDPPVKQELKRLRRARAQTPDSLRDKIREIDEQIALLEGTYE
jgi:hypothetical protein